MSSTDFIPVEDAARILGVTIRQANRYAQRVRTERAGRRILYHRGDVEALADELGAHRRLAPTPPAHAGEPISKDTLDYLRERDAKLEEAQEKLLAAGHRIGELEGMLHAITEERDAIRALLPAPKPEKKPFNWRFWQKDKTT